MSDTLKIRQRLKEKRIALGLTQQQLAAAAGVDATTISRIELGKSTPEPATLALLAPHLKTTLPGLLLGDAAPQLPGEQKDPYSWRVKFIASTPTTEDERMHLRSIYYGWGDPGMAEWKRRLADYRKARPPGKR